MAAVKRRSRKSSRKGKSSKKKTSPSSSPESAAQLGPKSKYLSNETQSEMAKWESKRLSTAAPPFTLKDIRAAIPAHCFHRSFFMSTFYLVVDIALVAGFVYAALHIDSHLTNEFMGVSPLVGTILRHVAWFAYWMAAGHVGVGIWVIGHECGHHGYTGIEWLNDVVGFFVHSALLVPFFSWQISHRRHHSNTGNLDRDEVHVPPIWDGSLKKADKAKQDDEHHLEYFPLMRASFFKRVRNVLVMLFLGWPMYLLTNASSHVNYPKNRYVNHFMPSSPIYNAKEGPLIVLSDIGVLGALYGLYLLGTVIGHVNMLYLYGPPYLVVNLYLVLITYLQHTDLALAHYDSKEWEWLRGALCTIDRNYGFLNIVFHHITDTHVVHHLFSNMPHYHAQEATEAVKPMLQGYYRYDQTPITALTWWSHSMSPFVMKESEVEPNGRDHVYWYYPHEAYLREKMVHN